MAARAKRTSVIGRFAQVLDKAGTRLRVTVIDKVAGTNRAKRVRVQTPGPCQGEVLMPGSYSLIEFE